MTPIKATYKIGDPDKIFVTLEINYEQKTYEIKPHRTGEQFQFKSTRIQSDTFDRQSEVADLIAKAVRTAEELLTNTK